MPLLLALLLVPAVLVALALLMPLALFLRYRAGTARRPARTWVAVLNAGGFLFSAATFLAASALTTVWLPGAFSHAALGLAGGGALGLAGVALTRWERTPRALFYTPNRWLVLSITLLVLARLAYGGWRAWHAWHAPASDSSWLAASGATGALAAGGIVIGYSFAFWLGLWRRARRLERPAL